MDHKSDGTSVINSLSDSEMPLFDLESQQLDFDNYILDTSSDADSSIFDCSLDESFQQIKNDLEQLNVASPKKINYKTACTEASVLDDDFPEISIDERFDVMKDRIRNYQRNCRANETEMLREYIIQMNTLVIDSEGKINDNLE